MKSNLRRLTVALGITALLFGVGACGGVEEDEHDTPWAEVGEIDQAVMAKQPITLSRCQTRCVDICSDLDSGSPGGEWEECIDMCLDFLC